MSETKKVSLPSGREVTIKRPGILAFRDVYGVLPTLGSGDGNGEAQPMAKQIDASIKLVCRCCVEPRVSDQDPAPEGTVSVDSFDFKDWGALASAINEFAGFGEAEEALGPFSETKTPS